MNLVNKHVVITGGTSGIGYQIVKKLHMQNKVTVLGRCPDKLNQLKSLSGTINIHQADLANAADVEKAATAITEQHKTIDVLINNAAVQYMPAFTSPDFSAQSIIDEIAINFTSACSLIYLLLPRLQAADQAIILNVNSGLALSPKKSSAVYCGTKAALNIFSQSLRYQLEQTNTLVLQAFLPLVDTALSGGNSTGKMSAATAASHIIRGLERETPENYIGIVKLMRFLLLTAPFLLKSMLKTK